MSDYRSTGRLYRDPSHALAGDAGFELAVGRMWGWAWIAAAVSVALILAIAFGIGHQPKRIAAKDQTLAVTRIDPAPSMAPAPAPTRR